MRKLIVLTAFIASPQWCHAGENCLWLNAATAAGILGGPVTLQVFQMPHGTSVAGSANAKSSAGPMNANASAPSYVTMSTDDEDCSFARVAGKISSDMRIEVRTMYRSRKEFTARLATCGNDKVSLRAIGNEAVACDTGHEPVAHSKHVSEEVVGRVRDRAFLIRITSNDAAANRAALRESAQTAAEIVAGNLF